MDLSLLIFTLETYRFCMKCIEFTTRTYNFKNLAVGSLIWSSKTGVNSSSFPQKGGGSDGAGDDGGDGGGDGNSAAATATTGGVIETLPWS
jgi:hypothetical protein